MESQREEMKIKLKCTNETIFLRKITEIPLPE